MKFYRKKAKVAADFIPGPFKGVDGVEYPDGAYHCVEAGEAAYVNKAKFEENNEPTKAPKRTGTPKKAKEEGSSKGGSKKAASSKGGA